ncbi:MAG: TRAP transporter small permease, partial [Pseudomonadota bacterium]|nr:TRAP transporter small permease [Pseudomonadota bacterium]
MSPADPEDQPRPAATDPDVTGGEGSALPGVLGMIDIAIARTEAVMLAAGVLLMALNTIS